ncbi:MAG: acyl-CoA dehydrogenase [Chloroflexi bacterium]|nr:acyl-CoA dehydrogenase [Chloroflexota bacterium]
MDLRLTEFQELLQSNAEEFLAREAPLTRIREIEAAGEHDTELWRAMAGIGWTALPIAEEYGGGGGSLIDCAILIEQLCRAAMISPYQGVVLTATTVQTHGDEELKQSLLPRIAEGAIATTAAIERGGNSDDTPATTYEGGRVNGEKYLVEYADAADVHLVTAVQGGEPGIAVVEAAQPGVRIERSLSSIGDTPQGVVVYDDAEAIAFIAGWDAVDYLHQLGSAIASFECYAHAQKSLDMAVEYTQLRVQFGRPIGAFEPVQQRVADMAIQVEASRFLTHELIWQIGEGDWDPGQVALVRGITARAATDVTMWSHVLHGGIGFMKEYDLQFHTRRGKEAALRWGGMREAATAIADAALA